MGKYDDIFNKHFNNEDFDGDLNKRDMALKSFNRMMESLEDVKLSDGFIEKCLENINFESTSNIEDLFDEEGSIMLPIFKDTGDIIKSHGMTFNNIKLVKKNDNFIITEIWESEDKEYLLNQKYFLDMDIFDSKDVEIKEKIVKKLVFNNYIIGDTNKYLNHLPIDIQIKYYQKLLDVSLDNEIYEDSSIYRDKLEKLKKDNSN